MVKSYYRHKVTKVHMHRVITICIESLLFYTVFSYVPLLLCTFASMTLFEKTKPILSFGVLCTACCVMEVEKTKPMLI